MFNLNEDQVKRIALLLGFIITIQLVSFAGILALVSFLWSRYDHDLKLIALTGVISIASQMMATASTLLVGRSMSTDTKSSIPNPMPEGSHFEQTLTANGVKKDG